jgi:branched-chain amino acid transport system substrate-binding protein
MTVTSRQRTMAVLGVAAATLALAACSSSGSSTSSSSTSSSTGDTSSALPASIPVTLVDDKTGVFAFYGQQLTAGVEAGIASVDSSGILKGSKIVLTIQDDASSAANASTLVASAVKSNAAAVLGPPISDEALATTPAAEAAKMPYLVDTSPGGILDAGEYVYSMTTPELAQSTAYAPLVVKQAKTISFIYANDNPTNAGIDKTLPAQVTALGAKVLNNIGVSITTTAVAAVATKAMSGSPAAIGLLTGGPQVPALVTQLRNDGYKGLLFGNGGSDGTVTAAGAAANGYQYQGEWAPNLTNSASTTFLKVFTQVNPGVTPHYPAIDGYNEILFLAASLANAKSVDHATLLKGMQSVAASGFNGPGGRVVFGGTGNRQLYSPVVFIEIKSGKVVAIGSAPSAPSS